MDNGSISGLASDFSHSDVFGDYSNLNFKQP